MGIEDIALKIINGLNILEGGNSNEITIITNADNVDNARNLKNYLTNYNVKIIKSEGMAKSGPNLYDLKISKKESK